MDIISFITVLVSTLFPSFQASMAADSILLSNSSMRIVSKDKSFELGFFSPGKSGKHYLGIWYKNIPIQTVVWVANRVNPVTDSSATATLTLNTTGSLVLAQNDTVIWYSTTPLKQVQNPLAELLDSGNLVVREEKDNNPEAYLWQSFDYPTDTLLSGMKLGYNLRTGLNRRLTSWKTPEDPSPGEFSITIEPRDYPELYIMKGDSKFFRAGPWNGVGFTGSPELRQNLIFDFGFVSTRYDMYYYWHSLENSSIISRYVINQTEEARIRYVWSKDNEDWIIYTKKPSDNCDSYKQCGPNGKCVITASPACQCLKGFTPKSPQKWNSVDYSDGCIRNKPLNCSEEHKFMKLEGLKMPETAQSWLDKTMNLEQCRRKCSENCSCTAYTNSDIRGAGSGCALWFGDLIDIRTYATGGQDLYVRMPASELESGNKRKSIMIVAITIAAILCLLLVGGYFIYKIYRKRIEKSNNAEVEIQNNEADDLDLPLFDLPTIAQATENFSEKNKIGQGGFGPVYWGKLLNGQEVAVKKLSRRSELGSIEFKNEVKFIVKLQHRNLVKLLGCCIEEQEKLLVYEYMPNGSLDSFIFDETKKVLLDWSKRFYIIMGIGRGLLYLHQDSRLRIIHRDLKASNILLDDKLIPKISDFGLAKNFGEEEIEGSTKRVVGTYGYMAPEYAADGLYSVKSDVFSYGILVLEIISGKKNKGFYQEDSTHNLVGTVWLLWKEGKVLELLDKNMQEQQWNVSEALRCIHVSLLCVQQNPDDRPTIASAILMLESEVALPEPKEPGFFHGMASLKVRTSSSSQKECSSTNEITISLLDAR